MDFHGYENIWREKYFLNVPWGKSLQKFMVTSWQLFYSSNLPSALGEFFLYVRYDEPETLLKVTLLHGSFSRL